MPIDVPSAGAASFPTRIAPPGGWLEDASAIFQRAFLRAAFRSLIRPAYGIRFQRWWVAVLSLLMPGVGGVTRTKMVANGVPAEMVSSNSSMGKEGVLLYLHGGAFCLGSPQSHRSITTRLAKYTGLSLCVPDYRLAPEHPSPAALQDAIACYDFLVASGTASNRIIVGGDSAGGALAISLCLSLRDRGGAMPSGLILISPVTDPSMSGESLVSKASEDPMINPGWIQQGTAAYRANLQDAVNTPLSADLSGLPPTLIQVGDQEILLSDSTRFAQRAISHGVQCQLEIHAQRWHVFHLQAFYLASARTALRRMAQFAKAQL
jgi:cyclohexanone monooxygenase